MDEFEKTKNRLMDLAHWFRAYKNISPALKPHADALVDVMLDATVDRDDRFSAAATLAEIMYPQPAVDVETEWV